VAELHYHLRGDLDMSNADDLQEDLASASRGLRGIVIDCAELTFIDTYGIKALIAMQRALAAEGRTFRVANASPTLRRRCDATDLTDMFRLADSEPISNAVG
jgi:anti-sigma B factor antagonist